MAKGGASTLFGGDEYEKLREATFYTVWKVDKERNVIKCKLCQWHKNFDIGMSLAALAESHLHKCHASSGRRKGEVRRSDPKDSSQSSQSGFHSLQSDSSGSNLECDAAGPHPSVGFVDRQQDDSSLEFIVSGKSGMFCKEAVTVSHCVAETEKDNSGAVSWKSGEEIERVEPVRHKKNTAQAKFEECLDTFCDKTSEVARMLAWNGFRYHQSDVSVTGTNFHVVRCELCDGGLALGHLRTLPPKEDRVNGHKEDCGYRLQTQLEIKPPQNYGQPESAL